MKIRRQGLLSLDSISEYSDTQLFVRTKASYSPGSCNFSREFFQFQISRKSRGNAIIDRKSFGHSISPLLVSLPSGKATILII